MIEAEKKVGARLFWGFVVVFWLTIWTIQVVQIVQFGHGLGIGDGFIHPAGQRWERGGLVDGGSR